MALVPPPLPPPGPSSGEVLFRRMLGAAQARAQPQPGDAADWCSDPKFHALFESLQERLYDLEHAGEEERPPPDVLGLYKAAVRSLGEQLRPPAVPAYCLRASAHDRLVPAEAAAAAAPDGGSSQPGAPDRAAAALEARLAQQKQAAADAAAASGAGPGQPRDGAPEHPGFSLSSAAQERLQTQQRLQDELTDELLGMGSELKASTLAMHNAIRYRGKLLDEAEASLVHSAANAASVAAKAKQQHGRGRSTFCLKLGVLLGVAVLFCGMIVFIKATSLVGLGKHW